MDGGPTDEHPLSLPEGDLCDSPPADGDDGEEGRAESERSPAEEERTAEPPAIPESCPVQEQGEMETQTEPQEGQDDSPPGSPALVRDDSDHSSVVSHLLFSAQWTDHTVYFYFFVHRMMLILFLYRSLS